MTRNSIAFDVDRQPNDVLVAVGPYFANPEEVAAFFAFHPELGARSAPEVREPGRQRLAKGGVVHVGEHKDVA